MKLVELNLDPDKKTLKQFGFVALVAFAVLGALILWKRKLLFWDLGPAAPTTAYVLWGLGVVSALFSLIAPAANRFLYIGLILVTFPIGFVMSYLVMGLIFFLVLTPIGFLFRLIGRDPLRRRFDRTATTYYVPHKEVENVERYFRQY